jgi:hypothetical protein
MMLFGKLGREFVVHPKVEDFAEEGVNWMQVEELVEVLERSELGSEAQRC